MGVSFPGSTYRLQFHHGFTFEDAEKALTYLNRLGINVIYASPVFRAVGRSTHGYDVTDPLALNPEIGSEASFRSLIRALHRREMGWLQDVVPNHMAFSAENPWIHDLLVKGELSDFHNYFDLLHDHPGTGRERKLMLPFLGKPLAEVLQSGELTLALGEKGFRLQYFGHAFPLSMDAVPLVTSNGDGQANVPGTVPASLSDLASGNVPPGHWDERMAELYRDYNSEPAVRAFIDKRLEKIGRDRDLMQRIVDRLAYRPAFWKETGQQVSYRRFFTINGLICLNMQHEEVFDAYHRRILEWVDEGVFSGLRVDHVDGLYDPQAYLDRLRARCGDRSWLLVEKILEGDEELPADWPVEGTTGYDFLATVNNLLTAAESGPLFYKHFREWTGTDEKPGKVFTNKKRFILHHRLRGELEFLTEIGQDTPWPEGFPFGRDRLREAIAEFMVHCPVYKIYRAPSGFRKEDRKLVRKIFRKAKKKDSAGHDALAALEKLWLDPARIQPGLRDAADNFFRRVMQFTGPLMAKGLEDTAWYAYHPFLAHNEVGDSPGYFGLDTAAFHRKMVRRFEASPHTMNTLSTHDTKRGEDTRARLNVLGDLPAEWFAASNAWRLMNRPLKTGPVTDPVPGPADEYLVYQSLVGHLPMDGRIDEDFTGRFRDFLVKAMREAKENTTWNDPDAVYEEATLDFVEKILDPDHPFTRSLQEFTGRITPHGIVNSLTQTILKLTVPGVPDTYQGNETWNLDFVDPDNRRPVDFPLLAGSLDRMIRAAKKDPGALLEKLMDSAADGRVKQWITHLTLGERKAVPDLFEKGRYIPLEVKGKYSDHVIAFLRSHGDSHLLVALPLNTASMPGDSGWKNTRVLLPDLLPLTWKNIYTGEVSKAGRALKIGTLFRRAPFAACRAIPNEPSRRAGILLHISSLPGPGGTGDFGPTAFSFIDFLERTGQRYWQILPLSETSSRTAYSPYSSRSAFAGNTLFIDPGQLAEAGLTSPGEPGRQRKAKGRRADFRQAEQTRQDSLDRAFRQYRRTADEKIQQPFDVFRKKEAYWIRDYAMFEVLKAHFAGKPWYDWPAEYRDREGAALAEFEKVHTEAVERVEFGQFIFSEQWAKVKRYAGERGIGIFGDIPIYVDHDSADVWAHPGLFRLKPDHGLEAVAGVPPDYFDPEGQLWGMPLYDWDAMEKDGFRWWLERLRRNLQWFDLLRLDHFRGFEAYWEVPADDRTAKNGRWVKAPGEKFFEAIREAFPHMPFVAEDLGQISAEVYALRDQFGLPGMKVLQFGFGEHMAFSHHYPGNIPYNSIVYTGTHDNNTLRGWFRREANRATMARYRAFSGNKLKEKNVNAEMIRLAYGSAARLVVVPMQDWLKLDEKSRMNLPSTTEGNWTWRLEAEQVTEKLAKKIRKRVKTFGRY